uniref:Uncharacterized protein n=1 Tax=Haplochromis burtoni TaxID=8153 RepID=A0A3Q2WFN9_HAPBU
MQKQLLPFEKMMMRIFFACLFLALFTAGSSLSCKCMDHKFRQHNEETLNLLDTMVSAHLLIFIQILEEVAALFEEDHSAASWEDSTVRNFLNIVNKQAEELHSCLSSLSKKNSQLYFKRLSDDVLKKKGHSAEPWESTHLLWILLVQAIGIMNNYRTMLPFFPP